MLRVNNHRSVQGAVGPRNQVSKRRTFVGAAFFIVFFNDLMLQWVRNVTLSRRIIKAKTDTLQRLTAKGLP